MKKEKLQHLININNITNVSFNDQYKGNANTIGYFKDDLGYHAYKNDKNGNLIKSDTAQSENSICNKLAFDFLSIARVIDSKNMSESDKEFFHSVLINSTMHKMGIYKDSKITDKQTKDLIRFITNYRMNQIKLLGGMSINETLNSYKIMIDSSSDYTLKKHYEMLYDSLLIAYYNNVTEGIVLNKKLYMQKIDSNEYRIVDSEIRKLELKKQTRF